MFNYTTQLRSLTQHHKGLCHERDALSLFVEVSGNNMVRVHRQFYIHNQFVSFFLENRDLRRLNYRDVTNDLPLIDFNMLITKYLKNKDNTNSPVLKSLLKVVEKFKDVIDVQEIDETRLEEYVDSINDVFCQYYYDLNQNSFLDDTEVYERINNLVEAINYNSKNNFEDFKDNEKPVIKSADGEEQLFELRIYSVGQANCSALIKYLDESKSDYKVVLVFDLGYQRSNGNNASLDEMISKIDYDTTILISHFDTDHINNIVDNLYIRTNRWVFPNYNAKKKIALKTFQTLMGVVKNKTYSGDIYIFSVPYSFSNNISIHQYLGNRKGDKYQSTLMNSQCLVCRISINGKDILIPADALYEEFGDELVLDNKKYDYILIPHHACKYIDSSSTDNSLKIRKFVDDNTVGFVMCGKNNYGHANINHLSWYNNFVLLSFNSIIYDDSKKPISYSLSKRKDYHFIKFT